MFFESPDGSCDKPKIHYTSFRVDVQLAYNTAFSMDMAHCYFPE